MPAWLYIGGHGWLTRGLMNAGVGIALGGMPK